MARRARARTLGLAVPTVLSLVGIGLLLALGSPFVRRAGAGGATFASGNLVRTVQDSTVVCETNAFRGASAFDVAFGPRTKGPSGVHPASASVFSDPWPLVVVLSATIDANNKKGIYVDRRHCARTTTRVPLARAGLPGPPIRFRSDQHCIIGGRLLVRARAFWDGSGFTGYLVVRLLQTRKPVAFAAIRPDGSGFLYTSGLCS